MSSVTKCSDYKQFCVQSYFSNGEYSSEIARVMTACGELLESDGLTRLNQVFEDYNDVLWVFYNEVHEVKNEMSAAQVFNQIMSKRITTSYTDEELNNLSTMLSSKDDSIFLVAVNLLEHLSPKDLKKLKYTNHMLTLSSRYKRLMRSQKNPANTKIILPMHYFETSKHAA